MSAAHDPDLLRRYARNRDEAAFTALVERHLSRVYSCALRRVGGDTGLAKDVSLRVFAALAREAEKLSHHTTLTGWLHTTSRYVAANTVRSERRRRDREQKAYAMQNLFSAETPETDWTLVAPILDEAVDELPERDRLAILLRFADRHGFAEIGDMLRLTDDAARKRVDRALAKLRRGLARRGVDSSAAALAAALTANTVGAAPAGLATTVAGAALADAGTSGTAVAFFTFMSMTKVQIGIASLLCVGLGGWSIYERRENARLRVQLDATQSGSTPGNTPPAVTNLPPGANANATPRISRPSAKLSLAEIEAKLADAIRHRLWRVDHAAFRELLDQIEDRDLLAALAFAERTATGALRRELRMQLLERLAGKDPAAAAAWCAQLPPSAERQSLQMMVAHIWADKDPEAALQFGAPASGVFRQLALRSPENAAAHALQLPAGENRQRALQVVADTWFEQDSTGAVRWAEALVNADDRVAALSSVMLNLADFDPSAVAAHLTNLPPTDRALQLSGDVVARWAQTDASAAAKWLQMLPQNSPLREKAVATVAEAWARDEPEAAAAWIDSLPAGSERERAARQFIEQVVPHDPLKAASVASSLTDETARHRALQRVAELWLQVDVSAATRWIAQAPLSPVQKEQLQRASPTVPDTMGP